MSYTSPILSLVFYTVTLTAPVMAQDESEKREIVVTARSLAETERDLKACLARDCPPDEDIRSTLAHAENQFVEGEYRDARATLISSLKRNRKHKREYPVPVSDLLRANGNIAAQLGESDSYRLSVLDMRDTLKNGLPENDYRILGAEMEVADSRLRLGYPDEARDKYLDIEKRANELKMPQLAALAKLRQLSSLVTEAQVTKDSYLISKAQKELDTYISTPTFGAEKFAIIAEVLKSRLDRSLGKADTTDALIKHYASFAQSDRPLLIHANPINPKQSRLDSNAESLQSASDGVFASNVLGRMQMTNVEKKWVDIGFWINSYGKVEEPEILRSMGSTEWTKSVLQSIQSRIYTPSAGVDDSTNPGFYAVERYTLTANFTNDATGTHLRTRSPELRIERIDLSADQ